MLKFLANDPGRHWVDIETLHVATDAVCLDQRCSTTHEGISDLDTWKVIGSKKGIVEAVTTKLGKSQPTKQGSRPAGKPFVYGDDRAINLLNLFFLERHSGNE